MLCYVIFVVKGSRLTTQWLAALRVKIFKVVVFEVFVVVVLSGCQCWSPKGGSREKGAAGALLFEVLCPLCCSRPSLGPPDDLSSCSFEGQYAPRGPDTRTNDENRQQRAAAGGRTHENGHNLRGPKRGSVGPSPL